MAPRGSTESAVQEIRQRRSQTMSSIAVRAIQEMIVSGELVAGDRINESALAERLDISRGPIREACRSLEQAGLLVSKTNRGTFVREIALEEARHLYELRGAVAGLVGALIVKRGTAAEIDALQDLVEKMQVAADADDAQSYYKLNLRFHDALVDAARNPMVEETYHRIVNQLHLMRRRGLVQAGSLHVSNREHRTIVEALAARDPAAASAAMSTHVGNGFSRLVSAL